MSTETKHRFAAATLGLCTLLWAGLALAQPGPSTPGAEPEAAAEPAAAPADEGAPPPIEPAADIDEPTADVGEPAATGTAAAVAAPPPAQPDTTAVAGSVAQPKVVAEPASEPGGNRSWKERLKSFMEDDAVVVGKQVLLALLLFIAGWLLSKFIAWIVYRVLMRTTIDDKIAAKLGLQEIMDKGKEPSDGLERVTAKVVYYLLMLLVVIAVLQYAGFTEAAAPIQSFVDKITAAMPLVGKAVLILLVAYFGGLILQKIVARFLDTLNVDSRFAELSRAKEEEEEKEGEAKERPFSEAAGQVVFWLMMVFGLAGAVDALEIGPLAHAMRNVVDRVINLLPSVGIAVVIVIAGYLLGRIARTIIDNLLDSAGFNKLTAKLHLEKIFGEIKPSMVVGIAAMVFIVLQAAIAGLNELELETLSVPLTDMMSQFWNLLPVLLVAALIIAAGVIAGRVLRRIIEKALQNMEFDRLMERLGFGELQNRSEHLKQPHQLVGLMVLIAAILIATVQALEKVELNNWAGYLDSFLTYSVTHVAVALLIVAIGFAIGNYVRDLIEARRDTENDESIRWIASFARYAILVFAFTMAVHHLDVGPGFVLISFSLLFGGLCLALALAFGLGSREVAGEIVRKQYDKAKRELGGKNPLAGAGVKPTPVQPGPGGPIPGKPTPGKPIP